MIHNNFDPLDPMQIYYDPLPEHPTKEELEEYQRLSAKMLVNGFVIFIAVLLILFITSLFTGCTTTKYVTVPEVHTDTVRITKVQKDSVLLRDSIYVNQYTSGDTVFMTTEKWHTQYRDRWRTDTAYISRRDSIPVPYPIEKQVPAQLSWFQQMRLWLGNIVLVALAVLAGWCIVRWKFRVRKLL